MAASFVTWSLVAWTLVLPAIATGLLDASLNGFDAARLGVAAQLGAAWYVVAFAVPLVYVAHVLALRELLRRRV